MYLTAQRVTAPGAERRGINTFLYRHVEAVPGIDWERPNLVRIAEEFPGTLAASHTEVPPGGNVVNSYLDVVAAEAMGIEQLAAALHQFEQEWKAESLARSVTVSGVAIRLGMELQFESRALEEFRPLRERALALLRNPARTLEEPRPGPGLRILVARGTDESSYSLDEPSLAPLRLVHGATWEPPARVSVAMSARSDTAGSDTAGRDVDMYLHLASLLTRLAPEALVPLGGIRFADAETGENVWEWPPPAGLGGYCLRCHQQRTLRPSEGAYWCVSCGNLQQTDGLWVATLQ